VFLFVFLGYCCFLVRGGWIVAGFETLSISSVFALVLISAWRMEALCKLWLRTWFVLLDIGLRTLSGILGFGLETWVKILLSVLTATSASGFETLRKLMLCLRFPMLKSGLELCAGF
jgi:hypothetical protein